MASEGERDSAWNRLPGNTFMRAICVGARLGSQWCKSKFDLTEASWAGQTRERSGGRLASPEIKKRQL